jgi:glycosyltransferase involved in cell wall biosynthesis
MLFKEFPVFNSMILLGLILGIRLLVNGQYRNIFLTILKNKKILYLFLFLLAIVIYSCLLTTILGTFDYSIIKTLINQFIALIIGILLYALFAEKGKQKEIIKCIIYAFVIQACIQVSSFIFPFFNDLLNNFKFSLVVEKGETIYKGTRGLALSGSNFFGLSAAYGLIYIMYFINWKQLFNNNLAKKLLCLVLLFFGGIFAGRTSLIGFAIGFIYFFIVNRKQIKSRLKNFKFNLKIFIYIFSSLIIFLLILYIIYLITPDTYITLFNKFNHLMKFTFEMFYNLFNGKGLFTTSTAKLFDKMYFPVELKTFIFGAGHYTNIDATYYLHTDAGFMRNILFFGIFGLILLTIYQIKIFDWSKKSRLNNYIILLYILLLHIKGETLGFLIITQCILLLKILYDLDILKYNNNLKIDNYISNNYTTTSNGLVSVIMSVYNESEEELSKAVESIQNQTYKNIEVIILLDNPDNNRLRTLLKSYKKRDNRIKLIFNKKNLGLAKSLNVGIKDANGIYIARMDADDISTYDRIEKELDYLEKNDFDMVATNRFDIDENGNLLPDKSALPKNSSINKLLPVNNFITHSSVIIKSDVVRSLNGYRDFKSSQDYDLWLRLISNGNKIGLLNERLLYYRIRNESISNRDRYKQYLINKYQKKLYKERNKYGIDNFNNKNLELFLKKHNYYDVKYKEKFNSAIKIYDEGILLLKRKDYLKGILKLFVSIIKSKKNASRLISLFKYKIYSKTKEY